MQLTFVKCWIKHQNNNLLKVYLPWFNRLWVSQFGFISCHLNYKSFFCWIAKYSLVSLKYIDYMLQNLPRRKNGIGIFVCLWPWEIPPSSPCHTMETPVHPFSFTQIRPAHLYISKPHSLEDLNIALRCFGSHTKTADSSEKISPKIYQQVQKKCYNIFIFVLNWHKNKGNLWGMPRLARGFFLQISSV